MNKQLLTFIAIGIVLLTASCKRNILHGEGPKGTSTPTVSAFNAVDIDMPVKASINVQEGATPGIQLNGYENVIKHITAKIDNNTLVLTTDLDETWDIDCDDITVTITMPSITALSLSGDADADVHGNITGPAFYLETSGATTVVIDNINVDSFSTDGSGAASIEIKGGTVKSASYDISGAGKIKAFPLQTNSTSASISGAGRGEVTAGQALSVDISGAGTVAYKGHPTIAKDISGAGTVSDAN